MQHGKVAPLNEFAFPNRSSDLHIARIELESQQCDEGIVADVWMVNGMVFSITFNRPPKRLLSHGTKIKAFQLLDDPMKASADDLAAQAPCASKTTGALWEIRQGTAIEAICGPAQEHELARFLNRNEDKLPNDFVELLEQTDSFVLNGWMYRGTRVRQIVMPDKTFLVLAEHPTRGVICTPDDIEDKSIYFCDYEDNEFKKIGSSFTHAILFVSKPD